MTTQLLSPAPRARTEPVVGYSCPECDEPVEVEWRDWADSTSGPVEHIKIRCANRHWFLMLTEQLTPRRPQ